MRILFLILMLTLSVGLVPAQSKDTSKLTGKIFDAYGAVVIGAKITAVDANGSKYETSTDQAGDYELTLPCSRPGYDFKAPKYDISVAAVGFKVSEIKGYLLTLSRMRLDIGMEVASIAVIVQRKKSSLYSGSLSELFLFQ